ncbi:hypothetical protein EXIGLDRAFT_749319 [Exidia glandulosa HHB12029]|uniref:F-box domain-containing protein n=1 Tax=Exidia glandulosa HHB12029 TaxID=1314781 RepID=A0A165I8R3_EXIGL|nr:hypothetical protein EXIGLDRAFT_749319 [Exidia glandulosa HHB12029]
MIFGSLTTFHTLAPRLCTLVIEGRRRRHEVEVISQARQILRGCIVEKRKTSKVFLAPSVKGFLSSTHPATIAPPPLFGVLKRTPVDAAGARTPWTRTFTMVVFSRLPVELLDAVLREVDDFDTLLAAALSHKRWYGIYTYYKVSIDRDVLKNNLGPIVLNSSLRSIRLKVRVPTYQPAPGQPHLLTFVQNYKEGLMGSISITNAEYTALFERARISDQLERVYSRRYKDRLTQRTSRLSPAERERFRLSLHRLWLLSLFAGDTCILLDPANNPVFRILAFRRLLFYDSYTPQEVYDLHRVVAWMQRLVYECQPPESANTRFVRMKLIANGPECVLKVFKTPQDWKTVLNPVAGIVGVDPEGWKDDMRSIFAAPVLPQSTASAGGIPRGLSPIVAASAAPGLQCYKCKARPGPRLWNHENWDYLPLNLRLDDTFPDWMAGNLNHNRHERSLLLAYLGITDTTEPWRTHRPPKKDRAVEYLEPVPCMTVPRMMQALCDLDPRPQNARDADSVPLGPDEFAGVTSESLLCQACVYKFLKARLWIWWLRTKDEKSKTEFDKSNCWYGHACRLQAFKPVHAARYNHACRNTWDERKAWRDAERARRRAVAEERERQHEEAQVDLGLFLESASRAVDDDASASAPTIAPYLGFLQFLGFRASN